MKRAELKLRHIRKENKTYLASKYNKLIYKTQRSSYVNKLICKTRLAHKSNKLIYKMHVSS